MAAERRLHDRIPAAVDAACRLNGVAHRAWLIDVSRHGCCAELLWPVASPGDRVVLRLTTTLVLPATVRWADEGRAGLEFSSPLHGAMLGEYARQGGELTH